MLPSLSFRYRFQTVPNRLGSLWPAEKPFRESPQIQACAPNQNWQFATSGDLAQHNPSFTLIVACAIAFVRLTDVDHVMRYPRAFLHAGFCRPNIEMLVDLNGIVADDLAIE